MTSYSASGSVPARRPEYIPMLPPSLSRRLWCCDACSSRAHRDHADATPAVWLSAADAGERSPPKALKDWMNLMNFDPLRLARLGALALALAAPSSTLAQEQPGDPPARVGRL